MLDFDNLRIIVVVRGQVKPEFKNINKKSTDYLAKLTPLPPPNPAPDNDLSLIVTPIMTERQSWKVLFQPGAASGIFDLF